MTEACAERKGLCRLKLLFSQGIAGLQGTVSCSPSLISTQISNQFSTCQWEIFTCNSSSLAMGFFGTLEMELSRLFSTYRSKSTYIHRLCMNKHADKIQKFFLVRNQYQSITINIYLNTMCYCSRITCINCICFNA